MIRETDLYGPVRDWLAARGYTVRGEVKHCDIAAAKGEELILIELKRGFTIDLLLQAVERQRAADSVYVALPRPARGRNTPRWRGIERLLRRLELGLLLVSPETGQVEAALHPLPCDRRRDKKERRAILAEIAGRSGDHNAGGSTRRKLLTAYRENAVFIACCLDRQGTLSPRALRALGTGPRTLAILHKNVYGWFERQGRALYALTPQGRAALADYPELAARHAEALESVKGG